MIPISSSTSHQRVTNMRMSFHVFHNIEAEVLPLYALAGFFIEEDFEVETEFVRDSGLKPCFIPHDLKLQK